MPSRPTLQNVLGLADIADSFNSVLYFPEIPGGWGNSQELILKGVNVALPQIRIGHIRVPVFTQTVAFRGHRDHGNIFTASFYEDSKGGSLETLLGWMEQCSNSGDDTSLLKQDYAVQCLFDAYTTTNQLCFRFRLKGVWPQTVTPPPSSESSAPSRVEVSFSLDFIDLIATGSEAWASRARRALTAGNEAERPGETPYVAQSDPTSGSPFMQQKRGGGFLGRDIMIINKAQTTPSLDSAASIPLSMGEFGKLLNTM